VNILGAVLMIPLLGLLAQEGIGVSSTGWVEEAGVVEREAPSAEGPILPHDLHVSYGNLGVDGSLAILQLRAFKNDVEEALARFHGLDGLQLEVSPQTDALFLAYLKDRFQIEVDGQLLEGTIIGSGDDELDREPVWWYQIRFDAPAPIESARITNTVLFEIFDDQRNVVRVVEFPEEDRRAYYFAPGEETIEITFKR
jgi:hypothetical protein